MKILIAGFLIFALWASLATWIYVCKIKELCGEDSVAVSTLVTSEARTSDSLANAPAAGDAIAADSLTINREGKAGSPEMVLVYFDFDKSSFVVDSELSVFSDSSVSYMKRQTESSLFIIGHADDKGSVEYNQALGYRRAQSIKKYFESKGVPGAKITTVSKGETEPAADNSTDEGRAKNRRATISVINNKE